MIVIFLRLLLAHILADFIFQSNKMVSEKQDKKVASKRLYLHILFHILCYYLLLWDLQWWYVPLVIGLSHYVIDLGKLYFQNLKNARLLFFMDQTLHLIILCGASLLISGADLLPITLSPHLLLIIVAVVFLTQPVSVIIKTLISVYRPKTELEEEDSLQNAGKYIGILERLLVFVFIASSHWEGVGFLIAAKSIFRFSDLTQAKDRKLTEYILIGTLLSFGLAIIVGLIFLYLLPRL
ncbi:DUF3307 domain-containing protein [Galbibacter sp.]|uniref:DUF3307 domain-containing protein n=1 Tax=Galbibacter sp. TaxID=2918471 RepID=UPI003A9169B4